MAFGGECIQAVHGAEGIECLEAREEDEANAKGLWARFSVGAGLSFG